MNVNTRHRWAKGPFGLIHRGFTLVELMIVVLILGIVAAAVIAAFSTSTADSRRSSVASQLQSVRQQIQVYAADHDDSNPDLVDNQWAQLTQPTDVFGNLQPNGALGPYLPKIPQNPLNNNNTVVADISDADQNTGWVFDETTGTLSATNLTPTLLYDETTQQLQ
jgi:prepilin-type N-terminal cleavage/methylation domain-containing protein